MTTTREAATDKTAEQDTTQTPDNPHKGRTMWLLILAAIWSPLIGAVCTVIWWPRIRAWLGVPPREMDERDWIELAAAMNRHPAGKSQPGDAVQIMAPMTIGPGGIIITTEEEPQ